MWPNSLRMALYRFPSSWLFQLPTIFRYFDSPQRCCVRNSKCEFVGWNCFIYSMRIEHWALSMAWFWHWHFISMLSIGLCSRRNVKFPHIRYFVVCLNRTHIQIQSKVLRTKSDIEFSLKRIYFISLAASNTIHWRNSSDFVRCRQMETRGIQKKKTSRGRKKRESNREMDEQRSEESRSIAGMISSGKKSHKLEFGHLFNFAIPLLLRW